MHHATSNENISQALSLLEEAAKQKREELVTILTDKYDCFKDLIVEKEGHLMKSLNNVKDHTFEAAAHMKDVSVDKARELARDTDRTVHKNPWPYIAGSAVFGLLVGLLLDRGRK